MTIFKIQQPLNSPKHPWFFYAEGRRWLTMRNPTKEERAAVGDRPKVYAEFEGEGPPKKFIRVVDDQQW